MKLKDRASLTGIIATLLIHAAVIIACILLAFVTPLPLPGEEGVEVMLGSSSSGSGNDILFEKPNVKPVAPSQPSSSQQESVKTSNSDDEIFMPEESDNKTEQDHAELIDEQDNSQQNEHDQIVQNEPEVEPEPVVNPNALYKGSSSNNDNNQSGSVGNDGTPGSVYGSPNSTNESGLGGAGGGISFSLDGRSSVHLPKPIYDSQEQGRIVVEIQVNKKGDVIKAVAGKSGTTIMDQSLWAKTESAALKTKFSPNPKASEIQIGTITYNFRRVNE
ncbi:energy transducer TonB [Odoribacter sp. OttesenSCG-928-L07]|nr:energy transducer TonB [Odoribacter sp. OttesenSCG-928-L07]MDL2238703.1 energy transducer TonB [Bacteroidales bacterium OttesenSCG-928-L14]